MWYWQYLRAQEIATERTAEAERSRLGRLSRTTPGRPARFGVIHRPLSAADRRSTVIS
jgi:hypothetical protein